MHEKEKKIYVHKVFYNSMPYDFRKYRNIFFRNCVICVHTLHVDLDV